MIRMILYISTNQNKTKAYYNIMLMGYQLNFFFNLPLIRYINNVLVTLRYFIRKIMFKLYITSSMFELVAYFNKNVLYIICIKLDHFIFLHFNA
jgi:hypothetical protein